jgi:hypothetical protein
MLSRPQGHSAAGRDRSIEKYNYLIGNRIRDLPACNIEPQPITLASAPNSNVVNIVIEDNKYFVHRFREILHPGDQ